MPILIGHTTSLRLFDSAGPEVAQDWQPAAISRVPPWWTSARDARDFLTLAWRLGMPVDGIGPIDVVVSSRELRGRIHDLSYHACTGPIPSGGVMQADADVYLCMPPFAFLLLASSLPRSIAFDQAGPRRRHGAGSGSTPSAIEEDRRRARRLALLELVRLAYGICGTYTMWQTGGEAPGEFRKRSPLSSIAELRTFAEGARGLPGRNLALRALGYAGDGSASHMETAMKMLLFGPTCLGGYGLGHPLHNYRIPKPEYQDRKACELSEFECYSLDLALPEKRLALEYDSDRWHVGSERINRDAKRRNALVGMGWTVITVTNGQIRTVSGCEEIAREIAAVTGKRIRIQTSDFRDRQEEMRSVVLPTGGQRILPGPDVWQEK